MRILVADDTDIVRRAVVGVIGDCCEGVEVVGEEKNHAELVNLTETLKPDIVLADLNMPAEEPLTPKGFKAHLGSACLLVMSAWFDEPSKEMARACGAVELLDKSKLVDTLQPAIERCAGSRQRAAAG